MNWLILFTALSLVPAYGQASNDFINNFLSATKENVPGQDKVISSFSFKDTGDSKSLTNIFPKKLIPVKDISKIPSAFQSKIKIGPNDGKEYFFINYLEEADLKDSSGKEFKGMASVSRMVRKNSKTNEVEYLYPNGIWNKVLSSSTRTENLDGTLSQATIDVQLTPLADAGIRPIELASLLKDPELVCKWVGVPKPIKVSTGKYEKKFFCRSQVECSGQFLLGGYELDGGSYDVSCVNDSNDCTAFYKCMQYEEDDDFQKLKKSLPATSVQQ